MRCIHASWQYQTKSNIAGSAEYSRETHRGEILCVAVYSVHSIFFTYIFITSHMMQFVWKVKKGQLCAFSYSVITYNQIILNYFFRKLSFSIHSNTNTLLAVGAQFVDSNCLHSNIYSMQNHFPGLKKINNHIIGWLLSVTLAVVQTLWGFCSYHNAV